MILFQLPCMIRKNFFLFRARMPVIGNDNLTLFFGLVQNSTYYWWLDKTTKSVHELDDCSKIGRKKSRPARQVSVKHNFHVCCLAAPSLAMVDGLLIFCTMRQTNVATRPKQESNWMASEFAAMETLMENVQRHSTRENDIVSISTIAVKKRTKRTNCWTQQRWLVSLW